MKRDNRKIAFIVTMALVLAAFMLPAKTFAAGKTVMDLLGATKAKITEVTPQQVKGEIDGGKELILLDVRDQEEFEAGHLPGAENVSRGLLEFKIGKVVPNQDADIVLYCRTGARSAFATATLQEMGYTKVRNMDGAFKGWVEAGYPIYNRHGELLVKEFEKQE